MASVVLAGGTSHGPMLSIEPSGWDCFAERDPFNNELYDQAGNLLKYDDLLAANQERLNSSGELKPDRWEAAYRRCQDALEQLSQIVRAACPDYVVIIGNDQREAIFDDNLPALLVGYGPEIVNRPIGSDEKLARRRASRMRDLTEWAYSPADEDAQPGAPALASHVISHLIASGFDPATSATTPNGRSVGHAFGFVWQRVLKGAKIPCLPIMINTFYPPNQPPPGRCVDMGIVLRDAIDMFPDDARVAVIASGGLSHHVVDESLDEITLAALTAQDLDALRTLPAERLNGGSSELRNWIAMAPSIRGLGQKMCAYEPVYRNGAGMGGGMGFAAWTV